MNVQNLFAYTGPQYLHFHLIIDMLTQTLDQMGCAHSLVLPCEACTTHLQVFRTAVEYCSVALLEVIASRFSQTITNGKAEQQLPHRSACRNDSQIQLAKMCTGS